MSTQQEDVGKEDLNTPDNSAETTTGEPSTCDDAPIIQMDSMKSDPVPEESMSIPENHTDEEIIDKIDKIDTGNQVLPEETNGNDSLEKTNSSKSRELKSILALSKEAKLDTNLPAKRKESTRKRDFLKLHTFGLSGKSPTSKSNQENKSFKFPVTAEAELEEDSFSKPYGVSRESPKPLKRSRTSSKDSGGGGSIDDVTKKNRRIGSGEMHIFKPNKDMFCWRCHKDNVNIACETCPRSYHWKCLRQTVKNDREHWPCPECVLILKAESTHTRSEAMKGMTLEHLCSLLKYALNRMIQCQGHFQSEPFLHPVNDEDFPAYKKYIIQPMDLTKIEKNIKNNLYGSTQAFEADAKWILHNCIIFNSFQSKLTYTAKNIVRVCKQEMAEIELCPNCYLNANSKKNTWFVEVCPKPHILVWAKLKGFPYWPAKAMCSNLSGMVDVRFFGAHDRAWVHYKECYLYSEKDPNTFKQKRYDIEKCIEEVNIYIENLRKVYGEFKHAPYKTFLDPENELKQLQIFLPKYKNQRSYSKSLRRRNRQSVSESKSESSGDESKQSTTRSDDIDDKKVVFKEEETVTETKDENQIDEIENKTSKIETESEPKSLDETISTPGSPVNDTSKIDNDTTLEEGYGTDDSTADDIDLERRKAFVDPEHNNTSLNEETMEDEDDADTQIPNNISVDSLCRGKVRVRGGLNATPGKIKFLPRRTSEVIENLKRHSTESSDDLHQKLPRRNSDQSIISDCSRISNISDKINRIETFENMEVTLGGDDVARVSISEDISYDSSSKSGSENSVEIKRKPVQVDIDNAEFTISPSNKLKISDTLIKRLSDSSSSEDSLRVEKVKKNLVIDSPQGSSTSPNKSQTDILIEKFKDVIEHRVVDFNHSVTAESPEMILKSDEIHDDDTVEIDTTSTIEGGDEKTSASEETEEIPNKQETTAEIVKMDESSVSDFSEPTKDKQKREGSPTTDLLKKGKILMQPSITEYTEVLSKRISTTGKLKPKKSGDSDSENDENYKSVQIDKRRIFSIIHSSLNEEKEKNKKDQFLESNKECQTVSPKKNNSTKENEMEHDGIKLIIKKKNLLEKDEEEVASKSIEAQETTDKKVSETKTIKENDDKTQEINSLKSMPEQSSSSENSNKVTKITEIKPPSVKNPKNEMIGSRHSEASFKNIEKPKDRNIDTGIISVKASINQAGSSHKEFRSYSNMKNKNKANISSSETVRSISESNTTQKSIDSELNTDLPPLSFKKRKLSADEMSSAPSAKLVKLVPIESILNRGLKYKNVYATHGRSTVSQSPLPPSCINLRRKNSSDEMLAETIKSEPESDDDFQESENFEAKKRYLSALNISEKTSEFNKSRDNEIRTRARAEEKRERFKIVDNLTRVIDDVALNYSANHEGEKLAVTSVEEKKININSGTPWLEGEITVKSFAKLSNSAPPNQQRARKSFPTPSSSIMIVKQPCITISTTRKDSSSTNNISSSVNGSKDISSTCTSLTNSETSTSLPPSTFTTQITSTTSISTTFRAVPNLNTSTVLSHSNNLNAVINPNVSMTAVPVSSTNVKTPEVMGGSTMSHVILFPNPTLNYGSPIVNPVLGMVSSSLQSHLPIISAVAPTSLTPSHQSQQMQFKTSKSYPTPNIVASQNYIPQNENRTFTTAAGNVILNNLLNQQDAVSCSSVHPTSNIGTTSGVSEQQPNAVVDNVLCNRVTTNAGPLRERPPDEDLALLNSIVPENVTRAVSELMMRPPPRLKPRPPGMLSTVFDDGMPSSAGEMTAKINSVAHRMNDYLRGMLIETLEDLGRNANPEAKIISLQLEVEALKYRHNVEIQEIKKNMGTLLKDIQRSIEENRERIISEARSAWEAETIKRVELAKSKQWCANCSKEAKFYCCWNTSYCDYPCQQKQWPQHMGKCTQNIEKSTGAGPVLPAHTVTGQPVILRQTTPNAGKSGNSPRIVAKPTKVYMNNKTGAVPPKTYKALSSTGSHITVIETTPGNYELLGNGSLVGGKIYPAGTNMLNSRFKSANIMSVTPPTSGNSGQNAARPSNSSSEQIRSPTASHSRGTAPNFVDDEDE